MKKKFVLIMVLLLSSSLIAGNIFQSLKKGLSGVRLGFEQQFGEQIALQVNQETGLYNNIAAQRYVRAIGHKILASAPQNVREEIKYKFSVTNEKEVNAYACPGGYVFVTRGLLEMTESADELAFVIGHEIGHITRKHSIRNLERQLPLSLIIGQLSTDGSNPQQWSQLLGGFFTLKKSRKDEFEADKYGFAYAKAAGFDPQKGLTFFAKLDPGSDTATGKKGTMEKISEVFSTHPLSRDRVNNGRKLISSSCPF